MTVIWRAAALTCPENCPSPLSELSSGEPVPAERNRQNYGLYADIQAGQGRLLDILFLRSTAAVSSLRTTAAAREAASTAIIVS